MPWQKAKYVETRKQRNKEAQEAETGCGSGGIVHRSGKIRQADQGSELIAAGTRTSATVEVAFARLGFRIGAWVPLEWRPWQGARAVALMRR